MWSRLTVGAGRLAAAALATALVLSCLVFGFLGPVSPSAVWTSWRSLFVGERAGPSFGDLYLDLGKVDVPRTYLASVRLLGWQDRARRTVGAQVRTAELIEPVDAISHDPMAAPEPIADSVATGLIGRRVLASVTESAARDLKAVEGIEEATVQLVVQPKGDAVTVTVDRVLSVRPIIAPTGSSAQVLALSEYAAPPGRLVTITGSGFGATVRDSWVTCAGLRATVESWSDESVTFRVPDGARESGYVGVVVAGVTSNGLYFTPFATPHIDEILPREGAAGTTVTFVGSDFGDTRGDGWVSFAGAIGEVVSWSDTEIRVVVPRDATAGYAGVVRHGLSSNGSFFAPYGHPVVESVSASHVLVGSQLEITGRNFGGSPGRVVIDGETVDVSSWSNNHISLVVPDDAKTGYVGVINSNSVTSNGVYVTVGPRLEALSTWWGAPGSTLELRGVGFGAAPGHRVVTFGGVPAAVLDWSDTAVTVTVPSGASSGYVGVGNSESCSNGIYFVVEIPAHLSAVSTETVSPGQTITVLGSDFGAALPTHWIGVGGRRCDVSEWSDSRIVATVPDNVSSGYVGVVKQGVSSNGVWVDALP